MTTTRETYSRSVEPEPSVTVTDETFFGHGWQPLTICVLQAIWFMPQGAEFGVQDLVDWFRSLGWKSANGKPLGEDAVRRELALIRDAGYIHAERVRGEKGRVAGIRYEISKRPRLGGGGPIRFEGDETETRRSHHVPPMARHGDRPDLADQANPQVGPRASNGQAWSMAGVENPATPQVAPCASNGAHPPHPPEEVDTSSPYPLNSSSRTVPSQREEGAEFSPEDTQAAERFLQMLAKPWNAGRATAQKCAPRLLAVLRDQGWPSIHDVDHKLLERELTKNPDGVKNHCKMLPSRIADLALYDAVKPAARRSRPPGAGLPDEAEERTPTKRSMTELLELMKKPEV